MHQGTLPRSRSKYACSALAWLMAVSAAFTLLPATARSEASPSPVLNAARQELDRTMSELADQPTPPYFISYEISEIHQASLSSSFGLIQTREENTQRLLDIDLRVGSYDLDNTRALRGNAAGWGWQRNYSMIPIPLEDDLLALRNVLWFHTDRSYKNALETLTKVETDVTVMVEAEDQSADFSRQEPERYIGEPVPLDVDLAAWEEKLNRYTAPFSEFDDIQLASANLMATSQTRWHVNSEGAEIQTSQSIYRLFIAAAARAEDGMTLPRYESFHAFRPEDLPDDAEIMALVERMIDELMALRVAPVVDPYTGPAVLSGRAAGVFFHEVLGHRVEGHRQKREQDGQTFKKMIGEKILPDTFSVVFDPTVKNRSGNDLAGYYQFDNEGVRAQAVTVVDQGVLTDFLMSRTPIDGFPESNGHGRRQAGFQPVARQSNLMVQVSETVSDEELEAMLLERIRAENKPFGLIFEDIQGGFTTTGRTMPNAFNVLPILVYRLFPDGKKELVRGVDLIGTPLTALTMIAAAGDQVEVFNGTCGAESGGVPVSASSPRILISRVEVQKKAKSQDRLPVLEAPPASDERETTHAH